MENMRKNKKLFLIAVTDKEKSLNRLYSETILELLQNSICFAEEYMIEIHWRIPNENLSESLKLAIQSKTYEGYIVLLDTLETEIYNPNVMFEMGGIYHLKKPFVAISSHSREDLPFDLQDINVLTIPKAIINYVHNCYQSNKKVNPQMYFFTERVNDLSRNNEQREVSSFLNKVYTHYKESFASKSEQRVNVDNDVVLEEIREIKKLLSNTAEYIDGEGAAFNALHEAVQSAEFSLRTSRFANESIVALKATQEQEKFMESLYKISNSLTDKFERIICNNHPAKWNDIFNILFYGGNGAKVYVRKNDFSIHFELVIIDEKIGFIHFYQNDQNKKSEDSWNEVEKINSTLKIQGSSICQKLANIFDRLHHRDFKNDNPHDPSRTLLGIPTKDSEWDDSYANYGCFIVDKSVPKHSPYSNNPERRKYIIELFKNAFKKWRITEEDKVIMAAGIALVEGTNNFIKLMEADGRFTSSECERALELFEQNQGK